MKSSIVHECRTCDITGEQFKGSPCHTCSILHPDPLHDDKWVEHSLITIGREQGEWQGRLDALHDAHIICEKLVTKWRTEEEETVVEDYKITYRRKKQVAIDCSVAICHLRALAMVAL